MLEIGVFGEHTPSMPAVCKPHGDLMEAGYSCVLNLWGQSGTTAGV